MAVRSLKVPTEVHNVIRRLHPELKRKLRAALSDILKDPTCGKALKAELEGFGSLRLGRSRIIYRLAESAIEVVAIGPRESNERMNIQHILFALGLAGFAILVIFFREGSGSAGSNPYY